ncbi:MAG: TonB-dependent receptor [Paludibacteraceae bacterium]|nr:TonB-dependent receptor [Paludibacteraceae bacterium]
MKMRLCAWIAFTMFTILSAFGQSKISGQVFDPEDRTLPMADVILYASDGTTQIEGESTDDDGNFTIEGLSMDDYILEVSYMGYKSKRINVSLSETKPNVRYKKIILVEDADMLQAVEVSATQTSLKVDIDKKVYRVNTNAVSEGTSASEILKEIPSVEVDVEGKVSLRNSENVEIYINGKPAGLTDENRGDILDQLPAGSVQQVEVISNPSSKFDAEGAAGIINIIMKTDNKKEATYYGSVNAGVSYPWKSKARGNVGANINYTKDKWSIASSIGLNHRVMMGGGYTNRETYRNGDTTYLNQDRDQEMNMKSGFFRLGVDYNANDKNKFGLSGMFSLGGRTNTQELNFSEGSTLNGENILQKEDIRQTESDGMRYMGNVTFDYKHIFAPGQEWSSAISFSPNKNDNDQTYNQTRTFLSALDSISDELLHAEDYVQHQVSNGHNRTLDIQSDYTQQITSTIKLEAGVKASFATQGNQVTSERANYGSSAFVDEPALHNDFELRQNVYAAYVSYAQKFGKFGMQLGLRGELTDIAWDLFSADDHSDKKPYGNLFPSAFFSYALNEKSELQLSYTRRISRPRRYWLNPYVNVSDPTNIYFGNPNLDPEISNSTEFSYLLNFKKHTFMASVYYKATQDLVQQYRWIYNEAMWSTRANLATSHSGGLELIMKNNFKVVNLTYNINLYAYALKGGVFNVSTVIPGEGIFDKEVTIEDKSNFSWTGQITADFTLPKSIRLQATGNYRSKIKTAQGSNLHSYSVNLGLRKSFLNQKLTASLAVRDLLNSRKRRSVTEGDDFYQDSEFFFSGRTFNLNLSYNFGNLKNKDKKGKEGNRQSGIEEDDSFEF